MEAGVEDVAGLPASPLGRPRPGRSPALPSHLHRGAEPGRSHRELRPDHLREGRLGGADGRALPGRRDLPRRRARLPATAPGIEHRGRGSLARSLGGLRSGGGAHRARLDRAAGISAAANPARRKRRRDVAAFPPGALRGESSQPERGEAELDPKGAVFPLADPLGRPGRAGRAAWDRHRAPPDSPGARRAGARGQAAPLHLRECRRGRVLPSPPRSGRAARAGRGARGPERRRADGLAGTPMGDRARGPGQARRLSRFRHGLWRREGSRCPDDTAHPARLHPPTDRLDTGRRDGAGADAPNRRGVRRRLRRRWAGTPPRAKRTRSG